MLRYQDFIDKAREMGFMFFHTEAPGLACLPEIAPENPWHTGEDTDPWQWKDRAAAEKQLAYGSLLHGHKGFIAREFYPVFAAAFAPERPMEQRWGEGELSQTVWALWQLFEREGRLRIDEIRARMGVTGKHGAGRVDGALVQLMTEMYLTVAGSERKVSRAGQPYGWPVNIYERAADFLLGWADGSQDWPRDQAREEILDRACVQSPAVPRQELARLLGIEPMGG